MTVQVNGIVTRAARLHHEALVWDNHGCLPFENMTKWMAQIERYAAGGVDVAMINVGDSEESLELVWK